MFEYFVTSSVSVFLACSTGISGIFIFELFPLFYLPPPAPEKKLIQKYYELG